MLNYLEAQLKETSSSIKLTHVPIANNMGPGWGVRWMGITRHLEHDGSEQGSTVNISVFPELNGVCIVLANNKANPGKVIVGIQQIVKENGNH